MEKILTNKENQHYVPKFYLRYFSYQNNKKQIGVYNQFNKLFIPTAKLKTQASKKYFYGKDGIIEDWLCSVESIISKSINKMISSEELPALMTDSHVHLLLFLILMDVRNPNKVNQFLKGQQLIKDRFISLNPKNQELEIVRAIEEIKNNDDETIKMLVLNAIGIIPYCMDLKIKLIKNTSGLPFITSDNPLIKYNQFLETRNWNFGAHNGYGTIGAQMFLPLNEKYMLILFDPDIYKVGNKKEKTVEINDINSISQLNILQYLNCTETLFFNHKTNKINIENLIKKTYKYKKANETYIKPFKVVDEFGGIKENQEVLKIGSTDLKIKLSLQKFKYNSKASGVKLDNCPAQFRPKAEEVYNYYEKNKKN